MPRPRHNLPKPQPVSVLVTDPLRIQELVGEIQAKFELICHNYNFWKPLGISTKGMNRARSELKAAVSSGRAGKLQRLYPLLELSLNLRAREIAKARTGESCEVEVTPDDVALAVEEEIARPAIRGRSKDLNLATHIEQIMALIWEHTGSWPAMSKHRGKLYQPQPTNNSGRVLVLLAQKMDPSVTTTALAEIAIGISRRLRGKTVQFRNYNPFWDASFDASSGEFRRGHSICGRVETVSPIYRRIS